jgi:hypothetical protein
MLHGMSADQATINVNVAKSIYYATQSMRAQGPERRAKIAAYLRGIARTINDAVVELSAGVVPHGKCGEMMGHAQMLDEQIGDLLGAKKSEALTRQLMEAYDIERMLYEIGDAKERVERLGKMSFAAGYYNAAAAAIEAGDAVEDATVEAPISPQAQALHAALDAHFKLDEIEQLCFDLNIDWENLRGEIKQAKARSLILHCEKRGNLRALRALVLDARPDLKLI